MRALVLVAVVAGCSNDALEKRVAELERNRSVPTGPVLAERDRAVWWCPVAVGPADDGICQPELREPPKNIVGKERDEWLARASYFTAEVCDRKARTSDVGAACVQTRLVVCSTHDVGELNLCFASWDLCRRNVKEHPDRKCWAYFDGERLKR